MSDVDVQTMSAKVRERLRGLDNKEYGYVMIANKLPPEYRFSPCLSFLRNIPFVAVFDPFDPDSRKDGLYYVCNETNDAARARIKTLDDFKRTESSGFGNQGESSPLTLRGTTWILQQESMSEGEWIIKSKDCMYRALTAYKDSFGVNRLNFVFFCLSENAIPQMSDIVECCFSILGESAAKCVTILCECREYAEILVERSKAVLRAKVRECCIAGIPWRLLEQNVKDMVGPIKFEEVDATSELPYYNGKNQPVLNKLLNSWTDLEVYAPEPKFLFSMASEKADEMEKARNSFYQGEQLRQPNLFCRHDIERTVEKELNHKVEEELRELKKPFSELSVHVRVVRVPYEPGSGATTLCRRILWNKRDRYRCAVVKAITKETDFQVEQLHSVRYDDKSIEYALPVLLLVDNLLEPAMNNLIDRLIKRDAKSKCVVVTTVPISVKSVGDCLLSIAPLRQLDEDELYRVNEIVINATQNPDKRKGAEAVLERERRFIWLGLELFGRKYVKIEERLRNHVDSILKQKMEVDPEETVRENVLHYCCFLYLYSNSRVILPHAIVSDMLYDLLKHDKDTARTDRVHDTFGGLLLDHYNESVGFHGWRPAHPLVAEVVMESINAYEIAMDVLEELPRSTAYVKTYLCDDIVKTFLGRVKLGFRENKKNNDDTESTDWKEDVCEFSEIRSMYSHLIMDILKTEKSSSKAHGVEKALKLLITLCERSSEAYAWQQLARFIGREIGPSGIDRYDGLIHKMLQVAQNQGCSKMETPINGFDAAHIAIDMAIKHQHHMYNYLIKGFLEGLQLRAFKEEIKHLERNQSFAIVKSATTTCRRGDKSYTKACHIASEAHDSNKYPVIGQIKLALLFLEVVKSLPCFSEGSSFTKYLEGDAIPLGMKGLDPSDHEYIQEFIPKVHEKLNDLFGEMRIWQNLSHDETEKKNLNEAKIMASDCRRKFYQVSGLDRKTFPTPSTSDKYQPNYCEQLVQDIFFRNNENSYGDWKRMNSQDFETIYSLLKNPCTNGYATSHGMLICCKASLRLEKKPSLDELRVVIEKWIDKYCNSEWGHLFNYMIHFPTPNGSLDTNVHLAKESSKRCSELVQKKKDGRWNRQSRPEYFLGKEKGLDAFISAQEISHADGRSENVKTRFWRSEKVTEKLQRLHGQKESKGMIIYEGIQVRFDETRYPHESKDDLWFYIGFTIAGPYAFDPVNKDTFNDLNQRRIQVPLSSPKLSADKILANENATATCKTGIQRHKTRRAYNNMARKTAEQTMRACPFQVKSTQAQENQQLSPPRSTSQMVSDKESYASMTSRNKTTAKSKTKQQRSADSKHQAKASLSELVHASEKLNSATGVGVSRTQRNQQEEPDKIDLRPAYLKKKKS